MVSFTAAGTVHLWSLASLLAQQQQQGDKALPEIAVVAVQPIYSTPGSLPQFVSAKLVAYMSGRSSLTLYDMSARKIVGPTLVLAEQPQEMKALWDEGQGVVKVCAVASSQRPMLHTIQLL